MYIIGRYINSIREFNELRKELAKAIMSESYYSHFLKGKPARDGIKGYNPAKCIHPKTDIPLTDYLARNLIAYALMNYSCILRDHISLSLVKAL